jgi:hypothetical protein
MKMIGSFVVGVLMAIMVSMLLADNADSDYKHQEKTMARLVELCNAHDSTPKSFDTTDLTCDNNLVIEY